MPSFVFYAWHGRGTPERSSCEYFKKIWLVNNLALSRRTLIRPFSFLRMCRQLMVAGGQTLFSKL